MADAARVDAIEAEARRRTGRPHYGCIPAWAWRAAIEAAARAIDVERIRDLIEWHLVAWYGDHGATATRLRRCIACGRTSPIVGLTEEAEVIHEPDCAVAAVLRGVAEDREYTLTPSEPDRG